MTAPDVKARTPSNLRLRMIASIVMIAVASLALWLGGVVFWGLAAAVALFMMAEWVPLVGGDAHAKRIGQFALVVPLVMMVPAAGAHDAFTVGLLLGAALAAWFVTRRPALAAGVLYCGLPVFALLILRRQPDGLLYALWALSIVWATDIGAFVAGRTFGGPKLAPAISPAKTWSGLAGGILAAGLLAGAYHAAYGLPLRLAIATPVLAILAQGGDLLESWLKRRAGVKDSGNILPGHGGVLDRLDGVVPVAPVAALLVLLAL